MSLVKHNGESVLLQQVPFPSNDLFYGPLTTVFKRLNARIIPIYTPIGPFFNEKYPLLKRVPFLTLKRLSNLTINEPLLPPLTVFPHNPTHFRELVNMWVWGRDKLVLMLGLPKLTNHHLLVLLSHKRKLAFRFLPLSH